MLNADVLITGGTTSWERCFMALPTVLLIDAKNQFLIAKNLETAGAVFATEKKNNYEYYIKQKIEILDKEFSHYQSMSKCASRICDGLGVKRVVEKVLL